MKDQEIKGIGSLIEKEASAYSYSRKLKYKKKVTPEVLRKEIIVARMLGEMSGAERVISSIVANPDWTKEDIEAELHIFVVNCGDAASAVMGVENIIRVEDVFKAHGYYKKTKEEEEL